MKTYISLFSSAGVGCYGFKQEEFECVATNELVERRINVQIFNEKCKYESGYICGDITLEETKNKLYNELDFWKKRENLQRLDVLIATPPCQGMSVANHKKKNSEILRNSLVIESIKIIKELNPKFFVFENVASFMKTICTDVDGIDKPISDAIECNLGRNYSYVSKVINFKNYGTCSSRQRTVVIGVANDFSDEISPYELYPSLVDEKTLKDVIGKLKSLKVMGEIDEKDIYHFFRKYPEHMRSWITDLKEGESAFDNEEDEKKPHQIINNKLVINKQKNGDKYKRQYWNKVGPCIHTRNDQLASQNTIHPQDDRVFSIREIMLMMTVPTEFKWCNLNFDELNSLSITKKRMFLKKEEIKIRQSLGEAVPTVIFREIAKKMGGVLERPLLKKKDLNQIINDFNFSNVEELTLFIRNNPLNLSLTTLSRIAELSNTNRTDNAAYFTSKSLITEIMKEIPLSNIEKVHILEPSVGVGNFIPLILKKFEGKEIYLDLMDIEGSSIDIAKELLKKYDVPNNCHINFIVDDFLLHEFREKYDFIIGNPPFYKMKSSDKLKKYRKVSLNQETTNICSFFLDKAVCIGNYVALVFPKSILNAPEFEKTRSYLSRKSIEVIIDFGEKGFPGVLVETISLFVNNLVNPSKTLIVSMPRKIRIIQKQKYIFDENYPYWLIYRNDIFDEIARKLEFNLFNVFRDRQITNKILNVNSGIRVLKSRNLDNDGSKISDINGYDCYISECDASDLSVYSFLERSDVYLTPNMTFKPRVIKKPKGMLVNGSVAILIPKGNVTPSMKQLAYFSTDEYREFYWIARNYQTRSLNVDKSSVYFYGLLRE